MVERIRIFLLTNRPDKRERRLQLAQKGIAASLIEQGLQFGSLCRQRLQGGLPDSARLGCLVDAAKELLVPAFQRVDRTGIKLLLQAHPDVAMLARVTQRLQRGFGIQQIGHAQLDLAHAKQSGQLHTRRQRIPPIRSAAKLAHDLINKGPPTVVLVAPHIGQHFILGLGQGCLPAAQQVVWPQ